MGIVNIVMPVAASVIVTLILSIVFKDKEKKDEGFAVNYFRLSYRRKMIRTLTSLPIMIGALIVIYWVSDFRLGVDIAIGALFTVVFGIQLLYNYFMWKKKEQP
ncbi:hypothetical protein EQV77_15850 [Halobacillus fulvus]|nr:hypothetical protein EQV77_15850 [Halobacillus fulvus]